MSWRITPTGPASLGLLDQHGGAAAAYSLRNLSIYNSSPVVRVRRSSDNTEQDFTAAQVTDGTLTTFCGAGNGFVRTWYDQSGNGYHMTQTTTTAQPFVVSSGALQTLSGKPTLVFDGTVDFMNQPTGANWQSISCLVKYTKNLTQFNGFDSIVGGITQAGSNTGIGIIGGGPGTTFLYAADRWGNEFYYNGSVYTPGASVFPSITNKALITFISTDAVTGVNGLQIGSDRNQGRFWGGAMSEIIIHPSNQSANRTAIEANINAHYAIY